MWDRKLTGFDGNTWTCWQRHVQGKVVGLSWAAFREMVATMNPTLVSTSTFLAGRSYRLPRNAGQDTYYRAAFTPVDGVAEFDDLANGPYRAEIGADGFLRGVVGSKFPLMSRRPSPWPG